MNEDDRLRLAFCGLHPDRVRRLVEEMGSAAAVLRGVERGSVPAPEVVCRTVAVTAARCRARLSLLGVGAIFRGGTGYPEHLAGLPDAPDVLFVGGSLPADPGVAIVGTRRCTRYGLRLAYAYGRAAARAGWPVISGLARGIDAQAHRGMVEEGGVGVAVLGSGPDIVYPPEHRGLLQDIRDSGGALATEYPPGIRPEGWRFPPRNRIISGLARAVVVVEAAVTGGALITAAAALEHGNAVFAVPGDVGRASSAGCNLLIRDGAVPVLDADDLVEALSLVLGQPQSNPDVPQPPAAGPDTTLLEAIDPAGSTPEEVVAAADLPAPDVLAALARLEIAGLVRRDGPMVVVDR